MKPAATVLLALRPETGLAALFRNAATGTATEPPPSGRRGGLLQSLQNQRFAADHLIAGAQVERLSATPEAERFALYLPAALTALDATLFTRMATHADAEGLRPDALSLRLDTAQDITAPAVPITPVALVR